MQLYGTWGPDQFLPGDRAQVAASSLVFDGVLEEVPDIDADRCVWDICGWAMQPGDAVASTCSPSTQRSGALAAGEPTDHERFPALWPR